ncbi:MAG: hypothetical protein ACFFCW_44550 [Candidatus Hodarchaeota archaeon]
MKNVIAMEEKILYKELKWSKIRVVAKEDWVVILPVINIEESELVMIFFNP